MKKKTNIWKPILIGAGVLGGSILIYRFFLRDKIAEKRAKKNLQSIKDFDVIAFNQESPKEDEFTNYENV